MKRILFIFLMILIVMNSSYASKLADLEEIVNPELMEIIGDTLFVVEGAEVFSYDLNTMGFKKKFGRKGEGPGELKTAPSVVNYIIPLNEKSFLMASMDKAVIFTTNGDLIREMKIPLFTSYLLLVNDSIIGMKFQPGDKGTASFELAVLDRDMNSKKVFFKQKMSGGQNRVDLTFEGIGVAVMGDKLLVENSPDGFSILIFDLQGNKVSEIRKDEKKVRFSGEMEARALERLRTNPSVKQVGWENFKKIVKFEHGEFLPAIRDMVVDGDRIFVMTNNNRNGKVEFMVMDLQGKVHQRVFLPEPVEMDFGSQIFGRPARFYKFYKGKYYYLKENSDEEVWEFHVEALK